MGVYSCMMCDINMNLNVILTYAFMLLFKVVFFIFNDVFLNMSSVTSLQSVDVLT